ncbi:MAG: HEPN domain-containing protein [Bacteroidota bacterium]|nr:HEPN domain-containing protein [Bacteroidota bacterium]
MNGTQWASVQLKLNKAKSLLSEMPLLRQHHLNATIINRLYYACYHATRALLLTKNYIPKTHSGVVSLLHQHFVLHNIFDADKASFFSRLMQERMDDDYSDFSIVEDDVVEEFAEPANEYIEYIESLILQTKE